MTLFNTYLPVESLEIIRKIENNKNNIFELNISDFFKEYQNENKVFAIIQMNDDKVKIFLKLHYIWKKIK